MKKIIGFVTGGLTFNGNTINEKGLGGSESAMIYMAKELYKLGNIVYVFCNCDKPGVYDGVLYFPVEAFEQSYHSRYDVVIVSRYLNYLPNLDISNMTVFWQHDIYNDMFKQYAYLADKVFLMSEYQKSLWIEANPLYNDMIHVTRNGFDSDLVNSTKKLSKEQRAHNYIYASRPERGLAYLLEEIWPEICKKDKDARLYVCGYESLKDIPIEIAQLYEYINSLLTNSERVINVGHLKKKDYYNLLGQCQYMLYPTDFPEISCINAIEAQALGVTVISSNCSALKETVKTDSLVTDEYYSNEYKNSFINLLDKEYEQIDMSLYSWNVIAKEWNEYFDNYFINRFNDNPQKVYDRLIHNSDFITLAEVDPSFNEQLLNKIESNNCDFPYVPSYSGNATSIDQLELEHRQKTMLEIIGNYIKIKKEVSVLELGSYDGVLCGNVWKKYNNKITKLTAYDINQDALESFKLLSGTVNESRVTTINDCVKNLKSHDITADIIIVGEILEHIKDYIDLLNVIQSKANKDALVIFSTPSGPWSSIARKFEKKTFLDDQHINHFEMLDILTIFENYVNAGQFFMYHVPFSRGLRSEILGNFVFGFNNIDKLGFKKPDLISKAYKTRPYYKISTCLITKNEEDNLFKCLNSVKNISDEIIVVDTGSTDNTVDIARKFTDKVYNHKWEENDGLGSFATARNVSVQYATGDWIFYIDADEELKHGYELGNYVRSPYFKSFMILQKQLLDREMPYHDQYPNRLFKNDGTFKFFSAIHEVPKQDPYKENKVLELIIPKPVQLRHFGYLDADINANKKLTRNHELLLKDMKMYPGKIENNLYYMRDLMYFYQTSGNISYVVKGLEFWKQVNKTFENTVYAATFWVSCFSLAQEFRAIIETKSPGSFIIKMIEEEPMYFIDEAEYESFKLTEQNVNALIDK